MGLFGSDPPKAQILCLEDGDLNVEAQFNPNELSYDRSTSWGPKKPDGGCNAGVWASPWGSMQFTGDYSRPRDRDVIVLVYALDLVHLFNAQHDGTLGGY